MAQSRWMLSSPKEAKANRIQNHVPLMSRISIAFRKESLSFNKTGIAMLYCSIDHARTQKFSPSSVALPHLLSLCPRISYLNYPLPPTCAVICASKYITDHMYEETRDMQHTPFCVIWYYVKNLCYRLSHTLITIFMENLKLFPYETEQVWKINKN